MASIHRIDKVIPMMPISKAEETPEEIVSLLEGADVAWQQYKRNQGTKVTSARELDAFLDSL